MSKSQLVHTLHWWARLKGGFHPCSVCGEDALIYTADIDDDDVVTGVVRFREKHRTFEGMA